MPPLFVCDHCKRHVRADETRCPFCDTRIAPRSSRAARAVLLLGAGLSLVACKGDRGYVSVYGPPPMRDAAGSATNADAGPNDAASDVVDPLGK